MQLSSSYVWVYRRLLPILWYGVFFPFLTASILLFGWPPGIPHLFLAAMLVVGTIEVRQLARKADNVRLEGGDLYVRFGKTTHRIALENIEEVWLDMKSPSIVTLELCPSISLHGRQTDTIRFAPLQGDWIGGRKVIAILTDAIRKQRLSMAPREIDSVSGELSPG